LYLPFLTTRRSGNIRRASAGVAAVIDLQRDVDIYIEAAARKAWKIEHIIGLPFMVSSGVGV
jgi:hypothetical protein